MVCAPPAHRLPRGGFRDRGGGGWRRGRVRGGQPGWRGGAVRRLAGSGGDGSASTAAGARRRDGRRPLASGGGRRRGAGRGGRPGSGLAPRLALADASAFRLRRRLAGRGRVQFRDQGRVVARRFGPGLGQPGEDRLDPIQRRQDLADHVRRRRQLAVAQLAKHVLRRMRDPLQPRQAEKPAGALDRVHHAENQPERARHHPACAPSASKATSSSARFSLVSVRKSASKSSMAAPAAAKLSGWGRVVNRDHE